MTDAASFLGALTSPQGAVLPPAPPATPAAPAAGVAVEEIIYSYTTPAGILVEYSPAPSRFYRVNWVEVPSVTSVLGVLDKPALMYWGMKVGVEGVLELWERKRVATVVAFDGDNREKLIVCGETPVDDRDATLENLVALLVEEKLTVNHVRDKAGDRGTTVHDAFEEWAKTGQIPNPDDFGETERGYVAGLVKFLEESKAEPLSTEVMVGSAVHGYAGRYDIRLRIPQDVEMVVRQMPVRQRRDVVPAGIHLSDLKTSKGVYPGTHFRQLEAYEAAGIEGGYEPTDGRYVIHVDDQGRYEYVRSTADFEDFLAVLEVWHSNQRLKAAA